MMHGLMRVSQVHESAFHAWPQVVRLGGTLGPNRTFSYIGRFSEICSDLDAILDVLGVPRQRVQATHAIMRELQAETCRSHNRQGAHCVAACPAAAPQEKGAPVDPPPTTFARLHDRPECDYADAHDAGREARVPYHYERTNASLSAVLSSDFVCFGARDSGIPL